MLPRGLPVYTSLSPQEQGRLRQLIQVFLAEKRFYGCGGLTVTDEMRVTIAAEACLLLVNKGGPVYPQLSSILVYPTAFRVQRDERRPDGTVAAGDHQLLGESWSNGKVILSWDDIEEGVGNFSDGHNVVLHEFAHQLDAESGSVNGAPLLRRNSYQSWARVFPRTTSSCAGAASMARRRLSISTARPAPPSFLPLPPRPSSSGPVSCSGCARTCMKS